MAESSQRRSYVVTGGGRGVGRAIVDRLLDVDGAVVVIELDRAALGWVAGHPAASRVVGVVGSAANQDVAERAADRAERLGQLTGWVNNAAVFRDAALDTAAASAVLDLISLNLAPAVVGCATAIRRFLRAGTGGAIVNVSQPPGAASRPGCAALRHGEGRHRGADAGGRRRPGPVNAVALGSIRTERYDALLAEQGPDAAARTEQEVARLHPLGRIGRAGEVADAVAYLLSDAASYVSGTVLPIDGGRAARGPDPEET